MEMYKRFKISYCFYFSCWQLVCYVLYYYLFNILKR